MAQLRAFRHSPMQLESLTSERARFVLGNSEVRRVGIQGAELLAAWKYLGLCCTRHPHLHKGANIITHRSRKSTVYTSDSEERLLSLA